MQRFEDVSSQQTEFLKYDQRKATAADALPSDGTLVQQEKVSPVCQVSRSDVLLTQSAFFWLT